jgi:K+-transporting ATPase c subunit
VPLVARARPGSDPQKITELVQSLATRPSLPWDAAAFVNVLELNRALDKVYPLDK